MSLRSLISLAALVAVAIVPGLAHGAFPGLNGKIAFDRAGQIHVMNPDGTGQVALTSLGFNSGPAWSPDGTRIAFKSNRDGGALEIYVMNADGSGQTRLTNDAFQDGEPTWSPDGTRIAFVRFTGVSRIWVMNADGSGQVQLTNGPGSDIEPAWSPDGTRIAFQTDRDGGASEIYLMDPAGGSLTRLTNNTALDGSPRWSPDGTRIAFLSNGDGSNFDIYVMDANGANQTRLTNDPEVDTRPVWSPDGARILFMTSRDGNSEIYVMNADGSGQTNLTNDPSFDATGDWQPLNVALGDARLWLGAIRTIGMPVDVNVGIRLNGTLIGSGQLHGVGIGTPGFLGALLHTVPLARIGGPVAGIAGDTLAIQIGLRRSCSVLGGPAAGGVALWHNGAPIDSGAQRDAGSRFDAIVGGLADDFFLRKAFSLSRDAGDQATAVTVNLTSSGICPLRVFTPVGTWSMVLPGAGVSGEWSDQPTERCRGAGASMRCDVRATLRVFNPGSATAERSIAQVYLSADEILDADDLLVEPSLRVRKLDAGEDDHVNVHFRLIGESAAGKFLIGVVDATDVVAEANEANNIAVSAPIP